MFLLLKLYLVYTSIYDCYQKTVHSSESHPECQFATDSGHSGANEKSLGVSVSKFGKSVKTLPTVIVFPTKTKEGLIVYQQISSKVYGLSETYSTVS